MSGAAACRSCGSGGLSTVLSLGRTPLANALVRPDEAGRDEPTYPLDLAFCPGCTLLQITESVPPEVLFREYVYFSSYSDTMLRHARGLAERLTAARGLGADSLVVEIASNDGYLLQYFAAAGVPVLGVEPARNVARAARGRGVPTVDEFFGLDLARRLAAEGRRADVIVANNVMAHVPDVNGVVAGVKTLLKPGGVFVLETPYARDLIDRVEFDTIYHEHLFAYSATALDRLLRRHGLAAVDIERVSIHGGSLRVTAAHEGAEAARPSVRALLDEETAWAGRLDHYRDFAARVDRLGRDLRGLLRGLKAEGKRLAAYGAAAKGSTLLNYLGFGRDVLDFVADRSPRKQGLLMPGVRLPIVPPGALLKEMPDYVLLLAWNIADEVMEQQSEYRRRGGRFIVPLPEPRVVS